MGAVQGCANGDHPRDARGAKFRSPRRDRQLEGARSRDQRVPADGLKDDAALPLSMRSRPSSLTRALEPLADGLWVLFAIVSLFVGAIWTFAFDDAQLA